MMNRRTMNAERRLLKGMIPFILNIEQHEGAARHLRKFNRLKNRV